VLSAGCVFTPAICTGLAEAVAIARLQTQRLRLRFQIGHGQVAAALAGAAPFQQVAGQESQVGAQRRFLHHGALARVCMGRECQRQAHGQRGGNVGWGHFFMMSCGLL
jgi:hypothetical protein